MATTSTHRVFFLLSKCAVPILSFVLFQCIYIEPAHSASDPGPDPFTPFASAQQYAQPPYGLNKQGVLYFDYGIRYNNLGKYENPTFVAAYANALYRDYLKSKDGKLKTSFIKQVDYLVSSAKSDRQGSYWPYPFANSHYAAPSGWYSGMTSGRILGVLVRAHHLTGEQKYLDFAKSVFNKLKLPLEDGGMTTSDPSGIWIEEVAHPALESFKVLNGHIFGLSGLLTYATYSGDREANRLSKEAINAVKNSLQKIDAGFLSYYSFGSLSGKLRPFAEIGGYNQIHVSQMLWLYDLTGFGGFLEKAMRFQHYENFAPVVTTSSSTNSKTNGPERMNMTFGNNYWSSDQFPVEIRLDFEKEHSLSGLVMLGHNPQSTPKHYKVHVLDGTVWKSVAESLDNSQQRKSIFFKKSLRTSSVKIDIFSDNGNRSVALDGIGLIVKDAHSPVVDFANYSSSAIRCFDSDLTSGILVKNSGFFVLPGNDRTAGLSVQGDFVDPLDVRIQASNNLYTWVDINFSPKINGNEVVYSFPKAGFIFYKLVFPKSFAKRINEVRLL